jgi:SAM-dependent methyltransferase
MLYSAHPDQLTPIAGRDAATSVARHEFLRLRRMAEMLKEPMQAHIHTRYTSEYFDRQLAKSDAKIAWQYDRMLRFVGVRPGNRTRVLDVGCGAAPGLRYLGERGVSAVGVDVSAAALAAARQILPNARLVRCDLDRGLPFVPGDFDLVLMSEVVEHVADLPLVLREVRRVLRPGGALVLTTPNLWDVRRAVAALGGPTWTGDLDATHINLQTPRTLRRNLEMAGFDRIAIRTGWKPLARFGGRRLPREVAVPYPPLIGNGIMASGRA